MLHIYDYNCTLDDIDDEDFDLGQGYGHDSSPVIKVGASHIKYVYTF